MRLRELRTAFLLVAACAAAFGDILVVPNLQTNAPGNVPIPVGATASRFQQVIGSGQFSGPIVITGIRFRSAVGAGPVSFKYASSTITMSTTQAYPNTNNAHTLPSVTYVNNVGPDATTVYNAALSGSSPGCGGPGPCPFDLVIPFATPFSYDPSKGRLLVDVVSSATTETPSGSLDGVGFPDSTSSTIASVSGDSTKATGALFLVGIVFGLDTSTAQTTPTVASVLNAGDFSTRLCPGVLAAIFGTNFGSTTSGVSITVGGKPGFVSHVAPNQINAQLPFEAAPGAATITVTVGGVTSAPLNITLDTAAPAFLTANGSGTGPGSVLNKAGTLLTTTAPARPGDPVVLFATGLGPTNPPTATGVATAANATATATLIVGGQNASIAASVVTPGSAGVYQVNFTVPAGVQGSVPMVLSIGGKTTSPTSPVTLLVFGISAVVNNASFGSVGTAAACSIASLFGNGFGTTDQTTGFPATTFQDVSVIFNGTPAPLFHLTASGGQIDLLVPCELPASGTVEVQVTTPSGPTLTYTLTMATAVPGIYFLNDPSVKTRFNMIAQFNGTAWLAMPAGMAAALKLPACTPTTHKLSVCGQPAAPGDYLVLYTTGLGKATPNGDPNGAELKTGSVAPADGSVLYKTVATATVTVGGLPAKVLFSGIPPGLTGEYQVDFQVPAGVTGDDVPVVLTIGGATDTRTVSIQAR